MNPATRRDPDQRRQIPVPAMHSRGRPNLYSLHAGHCAGGVPGANVCLLKMRPELANPPIVTNPNLMAGIGNLLRSILALTLAVATLIPALEAQSRNRPVRINVQLDWVPEPQHGGLYQAAALGYFEEAGLDVRLIPGGANANVFRRVGTGEVQFGQADSTNTILAIDNRLPVRMVTAVFQNDPSGLMVHDNSPVRSFEDLNGRTIMARAEWAFLPFLKRKFNIEFNVIPQNFNLGLFIADPNFIQQGYHIAEPYFVLRQSNNRVKPRFLTAWDAGFDAYAVLIGNERWMRTNPEATRAFIAAYIRGWKDYLQNDPAPAHRLILEANPQATESFNTFSRQMIIDQRLVTGRAPERDLTGIIERDRIANQIRQLEELGILPAGRLRPEDVANFDYLPR